MYYSKIIPTDIANGPGWRVSLFVSGCRRGCKGCFNKEAWSFTYGKEFTRETVAELDTLLDNPNVRGLSILGGDPFEPENREPVEKLCDYMRRFHPEKDIWVWTGFKYEDIKDSPILYDIDVLVDGPFVEELKDLRLPYCGSSNQRVIDIRKSRKVGQVVLWEPESDV